MMDFVINMLKLFGVIFLRFKLVPRIWAFWLVVVNLACLYYITHVEAQVVLAVTLVSVVLQTALHQKMGFTRLLGTAHIMWVPMFLWIATRLESIAMNQELFVWIIGLFVTNLLSIAVDIIDVTRFVRGERAPHYSWC